MIRSTSVRRGARLVVPVAMAAGTTIALAPAVAHAATPLVGLSKLTLGGPAGASLSAQQIRLTASGDAGVSRVAGARVALLPVRSADFAQTTRVQLGGTLSLQRRSGTRTRSVRLTALELRLGRDRVLTARLGGERMDVLVLDLRRADYELDAATGLARIDGARAALTRQAAAALAARLAVRRLSRATLGVLVLTASAPRTTAVAAPGDAPTPTSPSGGSTATPAPAAAASAGFVAPTPLARPAGAIDVVGSALRWRLRESFVRYVRSGEGVTATGGAMPGVAAVDGVTYDYDFRAAGGWYDPATGTTRLLFSGQITCSYAAHGIDLRIADPQIELVNGRSRLLATFTSPRANAYRGLGELATLDAAMAQTAGSTAAQRVLAALPVQITPWANEAVMSGFYPSPDDRFGELAVRFELPA